MTRTYWLLFALLIVIAIAVPKIAQSQSQALCNDGMCVVPLDDLRAVFRYIEHLENQLEKTCI